MENVCFLESYGKLLFDIIGCQHDPPFKFVQWHLSCSSVTSFCVLFIGDTSKSNFKRQKDYATKVKAEVEDLENIYRTDQM